MPISVSIKKLFLLLNENVEAGIDGTCRLPPLINAGLSSGSRTARQVESRSRPTTHRTACLPNKYQEAYQDGVVRLSCQTHNTHRFPFFPPFNPKGRRKYTSRAVPWVAATKTPGRVSRSCRSHQLRNHLYFSSSKKKEPLSLIVFIFDSCPGCIVCVRPILSSS